MTDRTYLAVPFPEKEAAKQLGARWDAVARAWYIPDGLEADKFSRWLPVKSFSIKNAHPNLIPLVEGSAEPEKGITLSVLMNKANTAVTAALSPSVWLKAEITELNNRNGHLYLTLAESIAGQQVAQARATLWANQAARLLVQFEAVTGQRLQVGSAVLLAVEVSVHARFGLSLTVIDIDPSFTLGDQQAKLQAIRAQLQASGLYGRNKQRPFPTDLCRIAVLSPAQAAGLGDFQVDAKLLAMHQLCQFEYFYASFQGMQTQTEMLAALHTIEQAHQNNPFDLLVIIRGGGAKQDLMFLNDLALATKLCYFPIAVATGIGHERDDTILDEVANRRFDTPSKVIAFIKEQIVQGALQAKASWQQIAQVSRLRLSQQKESINGFEQATRRQAQQSIWLQRQAIQQHKISLSQAAQWLCLSQAAQLSQARMQVSYVAQDKLRQARHRLMSYHDTLLPDAQKSLAVARRQLMSYHGLVASHHPQRLLSLGYMMARDAQGKVITTREQALGQTRLTLQFKDGTMQVVPDHPPPRDLVLERK
jgi:exodeoxyribonuclease VII large subunit